MTTTCWVAAMASSVVPGALSADVRDFLDQALRRPVLDYGESREQVQAFIRKRIPACTPPTDAAHWLRDAEALRRRVKDEVIFRGVPESWRPKMPKVEWGETLETGKGYRIRKLRYEPIPGLRLPALIYEPDRLEGKVPAVLNVNGHEIPLGKAKEYEQRRCINLAKRGILSIHPEWIKCGELNVPDYDHNRLAYLDLCGVSGVAVFYRAMEGALDVLAAHPNADPQRLAMTGLSGGGWQTILLSALDTRIALTAPNAGYIGLGERVDHLSEVGDLEQNPTDLVSVADYTHLTALLAPRPALLIYNEHDDCCFVAARARASVFEPIAPWYALLDKDADFEFHLNTDPGTHNYDQDNREAFYRFFNVRMLPQSVWKDGDIPCDDELLTLEGLRAGVPEDNATFASLAQWFLDDAAPPGEAPDPAGARARLRETLRLKGPLRVTDAELRREQRSSGFRVTTHRLKMGDEYSVPAAIIEKATGRPNATVVLMADAGKARTGPHAAQFLEEGARVVVFDPLLMGECDDLYDRSHLFAMMIGTVGERVLGVQVAQTLAVIDWVRGRFVDGSVSLCGVGWNAGIAALASGALSEPNLDTVSALEAPESLRILIDKRVPYEDQPALFCFGMLPDFDVPALAALCAPAEVETEFNNEPPKRH